MNNPQNSRVTIEHVTQQDYTDWLPLWKNYQVFYRVDISEDVTRLTWSRFLNPIEPIFGAVAKCDGKVVGLVHYLFHRSTWADTDYCYLEDLFVSEEVRGKQIGKQLIEYVQQQARKRHSAHLYWHTHETNLRGQRLYDWVARKSGMIEYRMPVR
ncbi:GNAT family N-acetyltransferase [Atlantibacter subterranea]|uniref:GNAT family N-acetyltransferase n=1 Tax=Atlantibacter subterraneus TaxID=255519 RepID=UPI0020C490C2|nr:GNAT family N-acetyltransferase [Atlantibacter subterranea]UTJ49522.1 GNAT family N-acetyltransferase [Atlantibacter subterranea]